MLCVGSFLDFFILFFWFDASAMISVFFIFGSIDSYFCSEFFISESEKSVSFLYSLIGIKGVVFFSNSSRFFEFFSSDLIFATIAFDLSSLDFEDLILGFIKFVSGFDIFLFWFCRNSLVYIFSEKSLVYIFSEIKIFWLFLLWFSDYDEFKLSMLDSEFLVFILISSVLVSEYFFMGAENSILDDVL